MSIFNFQFLYSSLAQSVEHLTVNQGVTGSSPVGGAILGQQFCTPTRKALVKQGLLCWGAKLLPQYGSPCWARTSDIMINSHALYRLS